MSAFGLSTIGQIAIRVQDLDRATAFYRDVLGIPLLFAVPSLAFFDCNGVRLMLSRAENPDVDHPASTLYYRVDHIRDAVATLRQRGAEFMDEPHVIAHMGTYDLWMAFLRDSEHNMLALMSEVPTSSSTEQSHA